MRRWTVSTSLFVLLALIFAGCIDEAPAPEPSSEGEPTFDYKDDRIRITGTNGSAKGWTPTLAEPPQLEVGEYWKIKLSGGLGGLAMEAFIVVAGQEEDFWLVGMPTHDFSNDLMVLHLPGMGQVRKDTLGFEAHDHWLDPVQFPLEKGDTWQTGFMSKDTLTAEVVEVDGLTATIEMTGNYHATIVYDAEIHGIRSMKFDGYAQYEVLEHGYDWHLAYPEWDGIVTVPHMSDLILCHGRIAGVVEVDDCALGAANGPSTEVTVDSTYDRVSFMNIIVVLEDLPATFYDVTATAPDGTTYTNTLTALDGTSVMTQAYKHDAPGGVWTIDVVALGPGQAFSEGIGYHVYDVEIATGRILPSIGEHQHGSDPGH